MENKSFAYARVSNRDQNLNRQLDSLRQYVTDDRDIFTDKASGKNVDREGLKLLMHSVRSGDTVYIHSLDRLGRNKEDIKELLSQFKKKGVVVRILDIPTSMADYGEAGQSIMELINNILIEVLAYQAQDERERIRKRQEEGVIAAKARGVHFGRNKLELPDCWQEDYSTWKAGNCTAKSLMDKYSWGRTTFYRKVKEYEESTDSKAV